MIALVLSAGVFCFLVLIGRATLGALDRRVGLLRSWLLAPGVGLAVVLLVLMVLNQAGWPVASFARPAAFGLAALSAALLARQRHPAPPQALAPFGLAALLALLLSGWPMLHFGFQWVSFASDDMANYVLAAGRHVDFGFYHRPSLEQLTGLDYAHHFWFMHVPDLMRFGSELLLAGVAAFTGRLPIEIFMPAIVALGLVQVWALAALTLHHGRDRRRAGTAALLLAASPLFTLSVLYQMIAQVGGLALLLSLLALLTAAPHRRRTGPAVLLAGALCITYPEVVPILAASLVLFLIREARAAPARLAARLRQLVYICAGASLFLRENLLGFIYTLLLQAEGGLKTLDPRLSSFPYYRVPSGLANLMGWWPLATPPAAIAGPIIVAAALMLFVLTALGLRNAMRGRPDASLWLVGLGLGLYLFTAGNGFGLYKLAMYAQPALAAQLAALVLPAAGAGRAQALVAAILALWLPVNLDYGLTSLGRAGGRFVEFPRASELGVRPPAGLGSGPIVCDTANVVAAKLAASVLRGRSLLFLSKDFFRAQIRMNYGSNSDPMLPLHPKYAELTAGGSLAVQRNRAMLRRFDCFGTGFEFPRAAIALPGDAQLLSEAPGLTLFNNLTEAVDGSPAKLFRLTRPGALENHLSFVDTPRGQHYYLAYLPCVALYQLEADPMIEGGHIAGIGRYMLLRVDNPSDEIYVRFAATRSPLGPERGRWSERARLFGESVLGLDLPESGAFDRIFGPVRPMKLAGAGYIALDLGESSQQAPIRRAGILAAYGRDVPLDTRFLVAYGRDISALSPAAYAALRRPRSVRPLEELGRAPGLEYAGIHEDGWLARRSRFRLGESREGERLRARLTIPEGWCAPAGEQLRVSLGGSAVTTLAARPGPVELEVPITPPGRSTLVELEFSFDRPLPRGDGRPVAARLELLEIRSREEAQTWDYSTPGTARLPAEGIDPDGWASSRARLTVPPTPAGARIHLAIEYPGWAGGGPGGVTVRSPDGSKHVSLVPGTHDVTIDWPASREPAALLLESSHPFTLPAPDGRQRCYRLLSVRTEAR